MDAQTIFTFPTLGSSPRIRPISYLTLPKSVAKSFTLSGGITVRYIIIAQLSLPRYSPRNFRHHGRVLDQSLPNLLPQHLRWDLKRHIRSLHPPACMQNGTFLSSVLMQRHVAIALHIQRRGMIQVGVPISCLVVILIAVHVSPPVILTRAARSMTV